MQTFQPYSLRASETIRKKFVNFKLYTKREPRHYRILFFAFLRISQVDQFIYINEITLTQFHFNTKKTVIRPPTLFACPRHVRVHYSLTLTILFLHELHLTLHELNQLLKH